MVLEVCKGNFTHPWCTLISCKRSGEQCLKSVTIFKRRFGCNFITKKRIFLILLSPFPHLCEVENIIGILPASKFDIELEDILGLSHLGTHDIPTTSKTTFEDIKEAFLAKE